MDDGSIISVNWAVAYGLVEQDDDFMRLKRIFAALSVIDLTE